MVKLSACGSVLLMMSLVASLASASGLASGQGSVPRSLQGIRYSTVGTATLIVMGKNHTNAGWRTYRNVAGGYSVKYPKTWAVNDHGAVPLTAVFSSPGGRTAITIGVQPAGPDGPTMFDIPTGHCALIHGHGLTGLRCFDTLSLRTYTTFFGPDRTYIISTGRRAEMSVYERLVLSFRLIA